MENPFPILTALQYRNFSRNFSLKKFPLLFAFRIFGDVWLNDLNFGFQPVLNILNTLEEFDMQTIRSCFKISDPFLLNGKRPCYNNTCVAYIIV